MIACIVYTNQRKLGIGVEQDQSILLFSSDEDVVRSFPSYRSILAAIRGVFQRAEDIRR
jgi:hypothetical protein